MLQGFATIAADRGLALITSLGVVQTFTRGCLTVFAVVVAIDLLRHGGCGRRRPQRGGRRRRRCSGRSLAFGLVRRGGLAAWFGVGIALFGAPLAVIGVVPEQAAAIVLLGLVGVGNALIDVGGFTLLARLADETVLGAHVRGLRGDPHARGRGRRPAHAADHRAARRAPRPSSRSGCWRRSRWSASWPALRRLDAADARARCRHRDHARGSACSARSRRRRSSSSAPGSSTPSSSLGHAVFEQGEPRRLLLRRRVRPGGGGPRRARRRDARARRLLRRDRAAARPAADGHRPRVRGRAPARERPPARRRT